MLNNTFYSELGIATHYVPSRRIPELIARLAALEGASYDAIDATIEEHRQERTSEDTAPQLVGSIRTALDYAFKPNQVQEIIKRLAKFEQEGEPEVRGWAKDTLAALHLRSPTSLKVALHAIRKGTSMSLLEALQMELSIATAFCVRVVHRLHQHHDAYPSSINCCLVSIYHMCYPFPAGCKPGFQDWRDSRPD